MTTTIDPNFTDDALRKAILRAAKTHHVSIAVASDEDYVATYEILALRNILDHLFQKLPDEPGSVIQNVTSSHGSYCRVMTLDKAGDWVGVDAGSHTLEWMRPGSIVSWEPFEND